MKPLLFLRILALLWGVAGVIPALGMGSRPAGPVELDGIPYRRIDREARDREWTYDRRRLTLHRDGHSLRMDPDRRQAWFNGEMLWLHEPIKKVGRRWGLAEIDLKKVVEPLFDPAVPLAVRPASLVVLDAGHGGSDSGARGLTSAQEKEMTLDLCGRVRRLLLAQGIPVELTRKTDVFIPLPDRPRLAAGHGADVFVSIHFNSAGNPAAVGAETYVLTSPGGASTADFMAGERDATVYPGNAHDPSSSVLAWHVHRHLLQASGAEDRGIRRARFAVLRDAPCPSVLVECGFLSNATEESRVLTPAYRQVLAEGIAAGIRSYVRRVHLARAAAE